MPSRFLLGLRVAKSVIGITLDLEFEEKMYSMLSILIGIVLRI